MGNREDLLAGAKRCLIEKGYAATTARDIAAASGVSLAAIGYHFGSKDALMNQAVFDSIGDWGDELQHALAAAGPAEPDKPLAHFEAVMRQTLDSFAGPGSGLWRAQLELLSLAQTNENLRAFIAGVQDIAATGLAELFLGIDPEAEPEAARSAGVIMHAMFIGLIAKYFLDPEQAPSARELAAGLRVIADRVASRGA
ncbi:MAG TPA: helix-turn-helix domain-containing protein [Streptosporangiaceae bacterium]|nr:helix-turn-helix domain-containing protein [Streptosporangiaceae bacterium]